jgi:hypothetical protein
MFCTPIPILWGDSVHDDRATLRRLLLGGEAFDARAGKMIEAPTIAELPHGCYRMFENLRGVSYF